MSQVFVAPDHIQEGTFKILGPEAHHLVRVLRKKVGDALWFFDGRGRRFEGRLVGITDHPLVVKGQIIQDCPASSHQVVIHLFQGLPRGSKFDYVIEKAVELGVDSIVPFLSEKNIVQLSSSQVESKMKRWGNLVQAAAKQCNRGDIPSVEAAQNLSDLSSRLSQSLTLVLWEKEDAMDLKKALAKKPAVGSVVNLVVGPEAGFSDGEIQMLSQNGATPVSLGKRILRTETAGLAALAILNYEWGMF